MKPKTTFILIVLLVVTGLGVWLAKNVSRTEPDASESPAGRVFPDAPTEANQLAISGRDGTKLVFVRQNNRWNLTEPQTLPARTEAVEDIIRTVAELRYHRVAAEGDAAAAAAFGLDHPRWTVSLVDAAGHSRTLQVGAAAPNIGGTDETYVRVEGDPRVLVVSRDLASLLDRQPKDFRQTAIWPEVRREAIVSVRVEGRQTYTLRKNADGWAIAEPFQAPADSTAVDRLLTRLTDDLKAQKFLAETASAPAAYGLDRPQLVVTLSLASPASTQPGESAEKRTLLLGAHRDKSICARVVGRPEIFTLEETMLEDLQPKVETLRSVQLLQFAADAVQSIRVARGEKEETLELRREGNSWTLTQPFSLPAETDAVDVLLRTLSDLRAERWIASPLGSAMDLSNARATITLRLAGGGEKILRLGGRDEEAKQVFCQAAGAPDVAAVSATEVDTLLRPADRYASRSPLSLTADEEILGLTLDRPDGAHVLAKCDNIWRLASPVSAPAHAKAMGDILQALRTLKADKIVSLSAAPPDSYAGAKDRLGVSLTVRAADGATRTVRLRVVKLDGNVYAWRESFPVAAIGSYPASLYETLTRPIAPPEIPEPSDETKRN